METSKRTTGVKRERPAQNARPQQSGQAAQNEDSLKDSEQRLVGARHGWQDRTLTHQREIELLLLGAMLGSRVVTEQASAALISGDWGSVDLALMFDELRSGSAGSGVKNWMQKRGVKVNGKVVEAVLEEVRRSGVWRQLKFAASGGDQELARELMKRLEPK